MKPKHMSRRAAVASAATAAAATVAGTTSAEAQPQSRRDTGTPADLLDIRGVVDGIDAAVDAKDWGRARQYFTDHVHIDFAALEGGPPARIPADDLVAAWRQNLYADKTSFHLRGNHDIAVRGNQATVRSKGYAFNKLARRLGDNLWEAWLEYHHELLRTPQGWRCTAIGITTVLHARGNEIVRTFQPDS